MSNSQDLIVVSAPNKLGEAFILHLISNQIPFAALVNNRSEQDRLSKIGAKNNIVIDTANEQTWIIPEFSVSKVYLFESSLTLCCRYLQICRTWTSDSIYVITNSHNPRLIYKSLGATIVLHTNHHHVSFLIPSLDI
ncbi:hypothetical protein [Paenibacillus faecalis]|uniref:hypothetical protein n=1 Tax=Paenibacillus faecalis TaxID=2079532 RepID=UPI000D102672|nr:hypothetical protein [Paenibacillus faecalis]